MKTRLTLFLALAAAAYLAVDRQTHASPPLLPFQGRLSDANGNPVPDGARVVQFKIYDAPVGGRAVWNGEVQKLTVNAGLVNTLLGTKADLSGVDFDQSLYLELTIDANADGQIGPADPPLLPRQSILPAVFANESANSRLLDGYDWSTLFGTNNPAVGTLLDSKIRDGSINASKVQPGTIHTGLLAQEVMNRFLPAGTINAVGGLVGIGTTNPVSRLHLVRDWDGQEGALRLSGDHPTMRLTGGATAGNESWLMHVGRDGPGALQFFRYKSDLRGSVWINHLSILPSGNVGIGGTPPATAKFHVASGNSYVSVDGAFGDLHVNGGADGLFALYNDSALSTAHTAIIVGGTQRLVATASGNVGIGTNTPQAKLDVVGQDALRLLGYQPFLTLLDGNDSYARSRIQGVNGDVFLMTEDYIATGNRALGTMIIKNTSGNVGIGTTTPAYKLHVTGSVAANSYNFNSDRKYKREIEPLANALETVTRLRGVSYRWREDEYPQMNFEPGRQVGFIAQEVREVLPEAVGEDAAGNQSVAYSKVIPLLVEAIKEQVRERDARISKLEAELSELKKQVDTLNRKQNGGAP